MAWAALKGLSLIPAAPATGQVIFSGVQGALVSEGTVLVRSDGYQYEVGEGFGGVIGSGGTFTTTITALTPGLDSNISTGSDAFPTLSLQTPIAGVQTTVTVASNFTGGADAETQQSLSQRMIQAFSNPPMGGAIYDYVQWGRQVPGVTRVFVGGPHIAGPGSVNVWFMEDVVEAAHNGIPQGTNGVATQEYRGTPATGDQLILANYIYPLRPATALVYAMAPVADPISITLAEVPNDATIRANILAAVQSFCISNASVGGCRLPVTMDLGGTIHVSQLEDAISQVPGLDFFEMVSPAADYTSPNGHIAVPPASITYV